MSRIQDVLSEIALFLSSDDQSSTPALRRTAADYAEACRALNAALAECRLLIDGGLLCDAQALDRSSTPSLSERAGMLDFPERGVWCARCREYGWELPPAIDFDTVARLASRRETDSGIATLITDWRRIARDGALREKVLLLRRIIAADPASAGAWRKNLANVERSFVHELSVRAEEALAGGDLAAVESIYRELVSPELITPVDPGLLRKLGQAIREYQHSKLREQTEALLDRIAVAYSGMDAAALKRLLREWEVLTTTPDFQPTPEELNQISDAYGWVESYDREVERRSEFAALERQLTAELDENAPLSAIERTYHALLLLDLPVNAILSERVGSARAYWRLIERRRHIRKCVYCAVGALLLILLVGGGILLLQRERDLSEAERQMRRLIGEGNPNGALELFEKLRSESAALAMRPELAALRADAEKLRDGQTAAEAEFELRLKRAEELLAAGGIDNAEFSGLFEILEKSSGNCPTALVARFRQLQLRRDELSAQAARNRDKAFRQACSELEKVFAALIAKCDLSVADPVGVRRELTVAEESLRKLLREAASVSESVRSVRREQLELIARQAADRVAELEKLSGIRARLERPDSFWTYTETLTALPVEAPMWASGVWRQAVAAAPTWRQWVDFTLNRELIDDPVALRELMVRLRREGGGPMLSDLEAIAPPQIELRDPMELVAEQVGRIEREMLGDSDLYELVFVDAAQVEYRFYTASPPQLERKTLSRAVKSIALDVSLHSGQEGLPFLLKVNQVNEGGGTVDRFVPLKEPGLPDVALPEFFTSLREPDLRRAEFRKAAHHRFLEQLIRRLRGAKRLSQVRREIAIQLKNVCRDSGMNPYMRMVIARRLLALAAEFYPLIGARCRDLDYRLERIPAGRNWNWRNPVEAARHPDEVREITEMLRDLDVDQMLGEENFLYELYCASLLRQVTAVGVVLRDGRKSPSIHFFSPPGEGELWVIDRNGEDGERIVALSDAAKQGNLTADEAAFCFHGQAVFTPGDGAASNPLAASLRKRASELGCSIERWPATWPVNRRGGE